MRRLLLAAALVASPAAAQQADGNLRFCPNRPSLEESPCTIDPGHFMLEMSVVDWSDLRQPATREDIVLAGDLQLRLGLTPTSEVQLNWTAYGHDRVRDSVSHSIGRSGGVGDVRIGYRKNVSGPDGKGFSLALEPYVTLPTGGRAIGAGTWGAGFVLPVSYDLTDVVNLQFTGFVAAQPNTDRHGRHFAYSGDWGAGFQLGPKFNLVAELQATVDEDPTQPDGPRRTTQVIAAGSLAYQARKNLQLDFLVGAGLNRDTPAFRFLTGGAVLF